jgi:hypothetical protein
MKTIILLTVLLLNSGQGISPCTVTKPQSSKSREALSLKEACKAEHDISLLKEDMSVEETLKTLGIWKQKKKIFWNWGGGFTYGSLLGKNYYWAFTFYGFPDVKIKLKAVELKDKNGKTIKVVTWLPQPNRSFDRTRR